MIGKGKEEAKKISLMPAKPGLKSGNGEGMRLWIHGKKKPWAKVTREQRERGMLI